MECEDTINITYGILNIEYWGCPSKANNVILGYSITKKWKWYCQTQKNTTLWEKLKIIWKTPNYLEKLHSKVFCQNLGIPAYTLENYSNFKSKFLLSNGNIFGLHDYFRARGNARFNHLSQLINTLSLSDQDFADLGNFNTMEILFCKAGVARELNWCS